MAEADLLKRPKDERIPCKDAMVAKKGDELGQWRGIPDSLGSLDAILSSAHKTVRDGYSRASPSVVLTGDIPADFDSHPTAAVVIDPVHGAICVVQSKGVTDHRVPMLVEVAPTSSLLREVRSVSAAPCHPLPDTGNLSSAS